MGVIKIADNIISPLGLTTRENYQAVKEGRTGLCRYEHFDDIPEPFTASLIDSSVLDRRIYECGLDLQSYTRFERMVILSVWQALQSTDIDASSPRLLFVLSTTKGNVSLLDPRIGWKDEGRIHLGTSARLIAQYFGNPNEPIVVSNACVSGLCAQITAMRALRSGRYDWAIVTGADEQSRFIISGFQSFKTVSAELCRPFDMERKGLNPGEAAATLILESSRMGCHGKDLLWHLENGAIRNDGYHISTPSKTGEGARRALEAVLHDEKIEDLALLNVHGTATLYNDEMESVAIFMAGLQDVPINSLKGYFGHTMGAAGILESILTMAALDDHTLLATKGYKHCGVSHPVHISAENSITHKKDFIKILSGFGGCNAAILFRKHPVEKEGMVIPQPLHIAHRVEITPMQVVVDGLQVTTEHQGAELLTELYRRYANDYPRFFKMDPLCKLGYIASVLLLQADGNREKDTDHRAVILFGRHGSICSDRKYQTTITGIDNYYPSPAVFVYTLANIVTGEIAIRNQLKGETTFYVLDKENPKLMEEIVADAFQDQATQSVLTGWVDLKDTQQFNAKLYIIKK
ncbi:MAG: 3-oxoacyl-ACP synthase [Prevotella sp.]|jgi:3-oxoacyl-[acyl-carrier-protein] synthase-1|nr:3-oxoacyl-ACP synthase [Prevotella sp.]MCI2080608.1 3-oxoacyl-ACP synthase [Prevotella sp.]MCI2102469.1 3-oxoacyl-ACP synthase [Prevotella sp.]HCN52703.1 3-oxoacyl-ACP synthase [Prevotella sp.]